MLRDLLRIEPDPHRIVAGAEQLHLADAWDAHQPVLDVQYAVVAQVRHVIAVVWRQQVHDHRQIRRTLDRRDAEAPDLFGQTRLGLRDAVLHQLLGLVRIGAELERDGERHQTVGRGLAAHVEHALDTVDRLLDRRCDRLSDDPRVRAGIVRAHHDLRRHDVRILGDRHHPQCKHPAQKDQHRQYAGEDRPIDEEAGNIHCGTRSKKLSVGQLSDWPRFRPSSQRCAAPESRRAARAAGR